MKKIDNITTEIISKEDEIKWKTFLSHYFPKHPYSKILEDDLVIHIVDSSGGHISKRFVVTKNGYGYISSRLAEISGYKSVNSFLEFTSTNLYKYIVFANGKNHKSIR